MAVAGCGRFAATAAASETSHTRAAAEDGSEDRTWLRMVRSAAATVELAQLLGEPCTSVRRGPFRAEVAFNDLGTATPFPARDEQRLFSLLVTRADAPAQ